MKQARIDLLKNLHQEDPQDPFPMYGLALEYMKDEPLQAEAIFEKLLTEKPDYLATYYTAAHFLSDLGKELKAIDILRKGILLSIKQGNDKTTRELKSALEQLEF